MGSCSENKTGNVCSGYMSSAVSSSGALGGPFEEKLQSIRIVNNIQNDYHYGIIFHDAENPSVASNCSNIIYSKDKTKEIECFDDISINDSALQKSATVYFWNDKDYAKSGTGVDFYGEPFGWNISARSGKYSLTSEIIKDFWEKDASALGLSYTGKETRNSQYKAIYTNFQAKSGSININGTYMIVLWSSSKCQVFFKDIYNLKSTELTAGGSTINTINIIPIK
jgi:hypothetical protein